MPVIGVTGGIASGKSTVSRSLAPALGSDLFDSDVCARELTSRAEIQSSIRKVFGAEVFDLKGQLDRARLRVIVFADAKQRRLLEGILHPVIRSEWTDLASTARASSRWLLVDIPLLFETGVEQCFDATVVVACSRETQLKRLTGDRGIEEAMASRMIATQMDILEKVSHAKYVIWNDSTMENLTEQVQLLSALLLARYG